MELTIDSASDYAGLALTDNGRLMHERTWYCHRRHSAEMLPAIVQLLGDNGVQRSELDLIVACSGPGSYTGLRVGVSLAKTLAFALGIKAVAVPRLLADAVHWLGGQDVVCAVHRAGRRDVAIACYQGKDERKELMAPRIVPIDGLRGVLPQDAAVVGEVPEEKIAALRAEGRLVVNGVAGQRRPLTVASLGIAALAAGASGDPQALLPVYLRPAVQEPAGA